MIKTAQTPSLTIGYEEAGSASGYPVLLLHGWRYAPRSFDDVIGPLATEGYRVIVPYSRCFGPTVYRSPEIFRSGQQAALGKDVIDLLDALHIRKATPASGSPPSELFSGNVLISSSSHTYAPNVQVDGGSILAAPGQFGGSLNTFGDLLNAVCATKGNC